MRASRTRRFWAAFPLLLLVACGGGSEAPGLAGGSDASVDPGVSCVDHDGDGFGAACEKGPDCDDGNAGVTNECYRCATPDEGCPCGTEGETVACGKIETRTADRVTCKMGERVCRGGTWTACGDSDLIDSKSYAIKGLGGVSGCTANPCDPYCKSFPDTPDPTLTDPDAGIVASEAGLSPTPTEIDAGPPVTCADTTAEAAPIPLDLVVMLDRSGSMDGSRWNSVASALKTFAGAASSKGTGMALNYFLLEKTIPKTCCFLWWCSDCSDTVETCTTADYADYAGFGVPMGTLPGSMTGHAVTVRDSINAQSPGGGTPTRPALEGAVSYAKTWQTANPSHKTVVILATDGDPNDCSSTVSNVSTAASNGFSGTPSIPTYVIGVGSSVSALDSIAKAGSGGKETYIAVPSGDTTAFVAAMDKIRKKAVGCDFILPTPPTGDINPSATDVKVKDSSAGSTSTLAAKPDATSCAGGDGYYYDDPKNPKQLTLCPNTCTTVSSDLKYKVELTFKCDASCGSGAFKATPIPVGMYVMLDKSGSMGGSRWTNITNALKTFINDPSSDGMAIGLDYFPTGANMCLTSEYTTPSVGISLLPGNRTPLISSINGTSPGGSTPTQPALYGAITYTRAFSVANPTYKSIVVLATDGEPNGCSSTIANSASTAKTEGMDKTPQINTYVIGVGSGVAATGLDTIASNGGTGSAYMVNDGSPTAFLNAMNDIRKKTLSCEFAVPPTMLGTMDPSTAQVRYVDDTGATVKVPRVTNAAACPASGVGWYFDDNAKPTKVLLCTGTCTAVKSLSAASLYVFYDCLSGGDGTFTRDYRIDCPAGTKPVWGYWSWNAETPSDSSIDFLVTSGNTIAQLNANPLKPVVFTNPPGPASLTGTPVGAKSTPVNTQVGFTFIDTSLALGGLPRNPVYVRVKARLKGGPTSGAIPTLKGWNQEVSCVPAE